MKKYNYLTCCIVASPQDLEDLYEHDRQIKASTFLHNVTLAGTGLENQRAPTLDKDWHVRFYNSKWKGQRCYHLIHSQIDYIFTVQ